MGETNNKAPNKKRNSGSFWMILKRLFSLLGKATVAMMLVGIITGSIVASVLAVYVFKSLDGTVDIDLERLPLSYTTIFYANDEATGETYELTRLQGEQNRIWVNVSEMPQHLLDVLIAAEDKRFMNHQGVDWRRTTSAFINQYIFPILPGTQGGSTITQQVIKNVTGEKDVSAARKVNEIFTALKLEKQYSKRQILEAYLNVVNFGFNVHGVQAAANLYFDKDVSELTIPESACIVTVTNAPGYYNPLSEAGMEQNKRRRNYIYEEMLKLEYITQEQYDEFYDSDVAVVKRASQEGKTSNLNWFEDHVINELIDDFVAQGKTKGEAWDMVYNSGLRVYTTYNKSVQESLEASYADPEKLFPPIYNKEYPETAVVILDVDDGSIAGLIGGNNKDGDRLFNRATQAVRHPGSTMKPISAYLQAFEMDMITWSTMFSDAPITLLDGGGNPYQWPVNYYMHYKDFPVTVAYAVQLSINTIPAQLMQYIGPQQSFNFLLNKLNFHSLVTPEEGEKYFGGSNDVAMSPMTLGGMTEGITPLEMAGAYNIFANGGRFVTPYSYTRVEDAEGNLLIEKDTTMVRVISPETAAVINRLLQNAAAIGTGSSANLAPMPNAGKTGTSSDDFDQWYIGMTPYYVGAVWMGYDISERIVYGNYPPPILWKRLMLPIHQDLPVKNFELSPNVVAMAYCTTSGEIATANCPGSATGWYKQSNIPSNCTVHMRGAASESSGIETDDSTIIEDDSVQWPWEKEEGKIEAPDAA